MTGTTSSRRYSSEPSNRYCSCGCQSDLYNVPEENKKTSVTKCTNCSESRLVRCQGACKCRRMCYCLICLGNRKCGDESKECTSCLRRIDTDHFLNGDGCQCKRKQLEIKNQYQNKVDKLLKIIGVVLNHNSSEEVERSARRGRYTQRIDDSEEDEVVDKGIGVDSSTSANTSVARDPSSQLANSAIKSKSGKGIGVGPSTSADTSVARDPSSQLANSAIKSKSGKGIGVGPSTAAEIAHAANKKNKKELDKFHDEINNYFQYALPKNIVTTGANGTLKFNIDTFNDFVYTQDKPPMKSAEKMMKYTKSLKQKLQERPHFASHPHAAHYLSSIDRVSVNCYRLLLTYINMIDFFFFRFETQYDN